MDFDREHPRRGTASYKWDQLGALFGSEDVLPLWVADMDFPCAPEIVSATVRRAEEALYGYTIRTPEWEQSLCGWVATRHGWHIDAQAIVTTPSVVTALAMAVELHTHPGDAVVLQSPVYHPFSDIIRLQGRTLSDNTLIIDDRGKYAMDLDGLRAFLEAGARVVLLCNPHNPGGRVWEARELYALAMLCAEYDALVLSDEIHADIVFSPHTFCPFLPIAQQCGTRAMAFWSATKTFNIPGIPSAFAIVPDAHMRHALMQRLRSMSLHMQSFFAHTAVIAAYRHGASWLDAVLAYVWDNICAAMDIVHSRLPVVRCMVPEGTYLLWVDVRALGWTSEALRTLMVTRARVAFNEGSMFGDAGRGFVRINCACPRSRVVQAVGQFVDALEAVLH
jgi:cystathionine beta-lyase